MNGVRWFANNIGSTTPQGGTSANHYTYDEAVSLCSAQGGRLPSPTEWQALWSNTTVAQNVTLGGVTCHRFTIGGVSMHIPLLGYTQGAVFPGSFAYLTSTRGTTMYQSNPNHGSAAQMAVRCVAK